MFTSGVDFAQGKLALLYLKYQSQNIQRQIQNLLDLQLLRPRYIFSCELSLLGIAFLKSRQIDRHLTIKNLDVDLIHFSFVFFEIAFYWQKKGDHQPNFRTKCRNIGFDSDVLHDIPAN